MGRYARYRRAVLATSRILSERGYFGSRSGTGGNVSMLVEGEQAIAVTPTRMRYDAMTEDDICVIDFDLRAIESARQPSIEAPMHIACYRERRDVSAVIHTHQMYPSVLSLINAPIPALFDEVTLAIGKTVALVPYALSGTRELHDNVARSLKNRCHCYILQNHGALCVGPSLERTFTFVELLEKTAATYVHALATGRPISALPPQVVTRLFTELIAEQDREIARKQRLKPRRGAR